MTSHGAETARLGYACGPTAPRFRRPGKNDNEEHRMAKNPRKAGLDIVVKVTDSEDNLRGRFLISAGSLYYFRKNAKEPSRR